MYHDLSRSARFWSFLLAVDQDLAEEARKKACPCSVYVDLNPIRAGLATTPEESVYTSGHDRILSMHETSTGLISSDEDSPPETRERRDAWLCELTLQETATEPEVCRFADTHRTR